ncbi:MAG: cytochrome c-type biogenesis protein CcmH [Alphaproteobacteria bacterium]|nr:cytochrome c-type biogenesis protein CcmH [Alphaproteobacteria bacterium]
MIRALALLLVLLTATPAWTVEPDEILADPAQEARAREVGQELRCLVCQNQAIDDSNAPLARDLRILVRERIKAGDSNAQVMDFVVARYGDFVRLRPPMRAETYLLWFGPALILAIALSALLLALRRRKAASRTVPLDANERARLDKILGGEP